MSADHEILHQSCQTDFTRRCVNQGTSNELGKIDIEIKDKEYLDFLSVCINEDLSVEEKLKNIVRYHVITYRNSRKLRAKTLFD